MGTFEYVAGTLAYTISATDTVVDRPDTITLSCSIDGSVTGPLSCEWDLVGDGSVISCEAQPVISAIGVYQPKVTVTDANNKSATTTFNGSLMVYAKGGAVYVTSDDNPAAKPPYTTAATAATNIVVGLACAQGDKELLLDAGTHYLHNITVTKPIWVRSLGGPDVTYLANTNNTDRLFDFRAGGGLEGVTVSNGNFQNNWGGAMILLTQGTLRNCRFIGNRISGHGSVRLESSASLVDRCAFIGNIVPRAYNKGNQQGPTCVKLSAAGTVRNCLFACNTNLNDEAATDYYSGVAINVMNNDAKIYNCTMVSNVSCNSRGAALCRDKDNSNNYCNGYFKNCISFGNTRVVDNVVVDGNEIGQDLNRLSNSLVYPTEYDYSAFDSVITDKDPLFKNAAAGNYRLHGGSPCVDAGLPLSYTAESTDLDGNPRIYMFGTKHGKVDLGCYESKFGALGFYLLLK